MEKKLIKIEIRNRWTGKVLFEYEKEDNTIKETVVEAVKKGADLRGAYLRDAYLVDAYLGGAKNVPFIPMFCPSDGAFIGWKKVKDVEEERICLVKLEIQQDSKRSSSSGTKCLCDYAKVLDVIDIETGEHLKSCINTNYVQTAYCVGEIVKADSFDEDRWKECSNGIHFFINRQEAEEYDI